tara:strand:+ start:590 stop:1432 length:843 start_codon:yes stop_codon:yes gene_type:complete
MSLFLVLIYSCKKDVDGCMNPEAVNYNSEATTEDNSCFFDSDGDGVYHTQEVFGCTDLLACNFNPEANANTEDGSCEYPELGNDCQGNQIPQIGEEFLGGILFYIDQSGFHGLIAAFEDIGRYEFGCYEEAYLGSLGYSYYDSWDDEAQIGAGLQNTINIVNYGCNTGWTTEYGNTYGEYGGITAAQAAFNYQFDGYSDWYLPSRDELWEMYFNIGPGATNENYNIGGFNITSDEWESEHYWSSSLYSTSRNSWFIDFKQGDDYSGNRYYEKVVRPIRSF